MFIRKPAAELVPKDLASFPVWEYVSEEEMDDDETTVRPVVEVPVSDSGGKIFGTQVQLANGALMWGTLVNLYLENLEATKHFLMLSIFRNDKVFHLARYHDPFWARLGPAALAQFLDLEVDAVFPISYNLSGLCIGDVSVTRGLIVADPAERHSIAELSKLGL